MSATDIDDVTCGVFRNLPPDALDDDGIHQFIVGEDTRVRKLTAEEAGERLGDPFATLLLLEGTFPRTAGDVLSALDAATGEKDPLRTRMFFLVGEGSQIPMSAETARVHRNLRFLVTCGTPGTPDAPGGPDVMLSAFDPDEGDVELMAWDARSGGFNYYRTVGRRRAWVFAGNSRHALAPPTRAKGPFESHMSGNFLMKELKTPWVHWDSIAQKVDPSIFAEGDRLRDHAWFQKQERNGALTCEEAVARPSIRRWTAARFEAMARDGGALAQAQTILEQLLGTPTVNLVSSHAKSPDLPAAATVPLPSTFFVDADCLGLPAIGLHVLGDEELSVSGAIYRRTLERFAVALDDDAGFVLPGDTHFVFTIPERAFEDVVVVEAAIEAGLLTDRLAGCLLMTDFPNPVFSPRRERLLRHVGPAVEAAGDTAGFTEALAQRILDAAEPGSPEEEFRSLWDAGDAWRERSNERLDAYYAALRDRLAGQEGFDAIFSLAESRRDRVRTLPIFESPLLFASSNLELEAPLAMRADGTVG